MKNNYSYYLFLSLIIMSGKFRPIEIEVSKDNKFILEQRKISEIFQFYSQPYVCIAMSGKGKTTLAIDLIYTFAKECTNIYYVTATKESLIDNTISLIPKCFRRLPTYENIDNIWNEIIMRENLSPPSEEQLDSLIAKIYGQNIVKQLRVQIENQKEKIIKRNSKMYRKNGMTKDEIGKQVNTDILAYCYELKRRIILFAYNDNNDIDNKLSVDDINIMNGLISKPSKSLLILDDITSELERLSLDSSRVYRDGSYVKRSDAFKTLLSDILTRGRHSNCIVVFFVHTIDIFKDKDKVDRLLLFDSASTQKINNLKSFNKIMRDEIITAGNKIFDNIDYNHMFLYYRRSAGSSDIKICCGKASLHNNDKLIVNDNMQKIINIYNDINSGITTVDENNKNNDENKKVETLNDIENVDDEDDNIQAII